MNSSLRRRASFCLIAAALLGGCARSDRDAVTPTPEPMPATMFERTSGWIAADGASSVDLADGRVLWLFGDTLLGGLKPDGGVADGVTMVNNTLGIGADGIDAADFYWGPAIGDRAVSSWALSPAARGGGDASHWLWPAGGGVRVDGGIGDRVVLFYMMMRRRTAPDTGDIWNFQQHGSTAVTILNPTDPPSLWRTEISPLRDHEKAIDAGEPVRLISWGPAAMVDPDDATRVLVYGVDVSDTGRKRLVLARSPRDTLDEFETWEFRTPDAWSKEESDAATLAEGLVDEFSIHRRRVNGVERYVLTQIEPNMGTRILVRFADHPHGAWSEPVEIYTCPEPASDARLIVYSAKAHPEIRAGDAGDLLVSYCVNSTDFRHMLGNAALYRPRMVRVPAALLDDAATRAD